MNTTIGIPLFYHPTQLLLIDDDEAWLNSVSIHLEDEFELILEEDSCIGYAVLQKHAYDINKLNKKMTQVNFEKFSIDYDQFGKIVNQISSQNKVVTVVIDYNMPKLDGLSFCRQARVEKIPVKFILLTGAAGLDKAVSAFNEGIIDAYLDKNDEAVISKLANSIRSLSMRQFIEMSSVFGPVFSTIHAFSDPQFIKIFHDTLRENNINCFFLMNASGSLILIDESNQRKILAIKATEDFEMMRDIAEDSGVSLATLKSIENKTGYPITHDDTANLELEAKKIEKCMVAMHQIPGKDIFYALINA